MSFLRIEIITRMERNAALALASDAVSKVEGWIVSHQLFSNMSATINFEIAAPMSAVLLSKLEEAGFNPTLEKGYPVGGQGDIRGSLVFTFVHDEPDMKRDVPAFG